MSLELSLLLRTIELIFFAVVFLFGVIIIEYDRKKHNRGKIGTSLRNMSASSCLFLLSTASLAIAARYSAAQNYRDLLVILLYISHGTFVLWLASLVHLVWVLKGMDDGKNRG